MRILFLYSNPKTHEALVGPLEKHGFKVNAISELEKGLESVFADLHAIAIVEHLAHATNAEIFCGRVRAQGGVLPVLVLLHERDHSLGAACLDKGADDFMKIPIAVSELVARIRSLLRRPAYLQPDEIHVGPLGINRRKKIVTRHRREVHLTKKQYAVLELLAIHRGSILSRDEIIEHVWGEGKGLVFERALETHIYMLRQKIEKSGDRLIHTAMGRGYRLEYL